MPICKRCYTPVLTQHISRSTYPADLCEELVRGWCHFNLTEELNMCIKASVQFCNACMTVLGVKGFITHLLKMTPAPSTSLQKCHNYEHANIFISQV